MNNTQRKDASGVLNETTMTVHKRKTGAAGLQTLCGQTYHLNHEQLRSIRIKQATKKLDVDKCGNCFEDGRGVLILTGGILACW